MDGGHFIVIPFFSMWGTICNVRTALNNMSKTSESPRMISYKLLMHIEAPEVILVFMQISVD